MFRLRTIAAMPALGILLALSSCVPPGDNPPPPDTIGGRWAMSGGGVMLTYWLYDDGTFHRKTEYGTLLTYGAGYYAYASSTITLREIGHAEDAFTCAISGDLMTWTQSGVTVAVFERQPTLDRPANNPPRIGINESGGTANVGDILSYTTTASDADSGDTLEYQWYADGVAVEGQTASSFSYTVPSGATSHTIKVVVSDQKELATANVTVNVAPVVHGFKKYNTVSGTWDDMGITVPTGTLVAFSYNNNVTVLDSSNQLLSYTTGAWTSVTPALPANTILAQYLQGSLSAVDQAGHFLVYGIPTPGAWGDFSAANSFTFPSGVAGYLAGGIGITIRKTDDSLQFIDLSAPQPRAWGPYPNTLPTGAIKGIFFNSTVNLVELLMGDRKLLLNDAANYNVWNDTGIVAPNGVIDIFQNGSDIVVRQ